MNVFTRGVRNAFRNSVRTSALAIILGLSIGLALTMLVAYQAVGKKIETVKSTVGNTISVSPAGVRGFEGGGTALTEDQMTQLKKLDHVSSVTESLSDRLTTDNTNLVTALTAGNLGRRNAENSGQSFGGGGYGRFGGDDSGTAQPSFTPPITTIGTTSPTDLAAASAQGGGTFTLKSGQVFAGSSSDNVALLGSTLASKNNLTVGSTFTAYNTAVKVVGIFDAGNTFSNNQVIMPLKTLQTLSSQTGAVTSAVVTVDSISNENSVTNAVKKTLGSAADVTNATTRAQDTITPLENIKTIALYSLIGAVIAGAIIILMTMIMIVRERRREIGVLKAIGAGNGTIATQFMAEAVTLTMLGAVIGVIIGFAAGQPITRLLVTNSANSTSNSGSMTTGSGFSRGPGAGGYGGMRAGGYSGLRGVRNNLGNIHAVVGWSILAYGLLVALAIAIIGSALAAFFIAKIRPAEVMRTE